MSTCLPQSGAADQAAIDTFIAAHRPLDSDIAFTARPSGALRSAFLKEESSKMPTGRSDRRTQRPSELTSRLLSGQPIRGNPPFSWRSFVGVKKSLEFTVSGRFCVGDVQVLQCVKA